MVSCCIVIFIIFCCYCIFVFYFSYKSLCIFLLFFYSMQHYIFFFKICNVLFVELKFSIAILGIHILIFHSCSFCFSIAKKVINDEEKNATQGRKELSSIDVEVQCELSDLPSIYQTSVSDVDENCKAPLDKGIVQMSSALMEDVEFDEEGFVDGKDLTKEEFLQVAVEYLLSCFEMLCIDMYTVCEVCMCAQIAQCENTVFSACTHVHMCTLLDCDECMHGLGIVCTQYVQNLYTVY